MARLDLFSNRAKLELDGSDLNEIFSKKSLKVSLISESFKTLLNKSRSTFVNSVYKTLVKKIFSIQIQIHYYFIL